MKAPSTTTIQADDGCPLSVVQCGEGPPLLLISGLGGKADFWNPLNRLLEQKFRLISFDHRGTGASGYPADGYTIERMAADALNVLDALGIPTIDVIGHSTGGAIAQTLAIDTPSRVQRLIISGSWARTDYRFRLLFELRLSVLRQAGPAAYTALGQLLAYSPEWIGQNEELIRSSVTNSEKSPEARMATDARVRMLLAHDRLDDLHKITSQTLVVGAADDMIVPFSHSRAIAERIDRARVVEISGGHFYPRTEPDRLARILMDFLSYQ